MLKFNKFILGPIQNNTYLLTAVDAHECILIDPAIGSRILLDEIANYQYKLTQIWITHAHFDHVAGIQEIANNYPTDISVFIHPLDIQLWQDGGGAKEIGIDINLVPLSSFALIDNQEIRIGESVFHVLHTPGHTQGHVTFYCAEESIAFCGDLIFQNSIGRTDLKGGNFKQITNSIREKILTLPDNTRLLSGHGPETTVGQERAHNPFL